MADTEKYHPSVVTTSLVRQLLDRDKHGQRKYGTSMDRGDLTPEQWAQHAVEELLDGAGYLTALIREIVALRNASGGASLKLTMTEQKMADMERATAHHRSMLANFLEQVQIAIDEDDQDEVVRLVKEARGK